MVLFVTLTSGPLPPSGSSTPSVSAFCTESFLRDINNVWYPREAKELHEESDGTGLAEAKTLLNM